MPPKRKRTSGASSLLTAAIRNVPAPRTDTPEEEEVEYSTILNKAPTASPTPAESKESTPSATDPKEPTSPSGAEPTEEEEATPSESIDPAQPEDKPASTISGSPPSTTPSGPPRKKAKISKSSTQAKSKSKSSKSTKPARETTPDLYHSEQAFTIDLVRLKKNTKLIPGFSKTRRAKNVPKTPQLPPAVPLGEKATRPGQQEVDRDEIPDEAVWKVSPKTEWESLKKYRKFVVGSENFGVGDYVYINHASIPFGSAISPGDEKQHWVARVLEIRAHSQSHVYLRVYWMYWPDELPQGRQPYHGKQELVASNHMEIVDAMTVNGRAKVQHWQELDEEEELSELFWRQKFEYSTGMLCEIREHCSCHSYYNPDKKMYGCPHCHTWLHEECLLLSLYPLAYRRTLTTTSSPAPTTSHKRKPKKKEPSLKALKERFRIRIVEAGASASENTSTEDAENGDSQDSNKENRVVVDGAREEKIRAVVTDLKAEEGAEKEWTVEVGCLCCGEILH